MIKKISVILIIAVFCLGSASAAFAGDSKTPPGQREGGNLGQVTKEAIAGGFDQGGHASDPSGDGKGKGDSDQPRSGLANVVEKGNLSKTIDAITTD